jgi:uncharacterized protein
MELLSALLIGFAGSFHCVGMCGPITVALPVTGKNTASFFIDRLFYNLARIFSYMLMGALFGMLGGRVTMAGLQQSLSIFLGVLILAAVLLPLKYRNILLGYPLIVNMVSRLKSAMGTLLKRKDKTSLLILGILNGFLPCGFVYIGIAGAAAAGDTIKGMLFMLLFGLGTLPAMLIVSFFGKVINNNIRRKLARTIPFLAALLALVFILRGLNLGIPYISPKLSGVPHQTMHCN